MTTHHEQFNALSAVDDGQQHKRHQRLRQRDGTGDDTTTESVAGVGHQQE